jgi:hypothetical protein
MTHRLRENENNNAVIEDHSSLHIVIEMSGTQFPREFA